VQCFDDNMLLHHFMTNIQTLIVKVMATFQAVWGMAELALPWIFQWWVLLLVNTVWIHWCMVDISVLIVWKSSFLCLCLYVYIKVLQIHTCFYFYFRHHAISNCATCATSDWFWISQGQPHFAAECHWDHS